MYIHMHEHGEDSFMQLFGYRIGIHQEDDRITSYVRMIGTYSHCQLFLTEKNFK